MTRLLLVLLLAALAVAPPASPAADGALAVDVAPEAVAGDLAEVRVRASGLAADATVEVMLVPVPGRHDASAGDLVGPHVHAPRPGWNEVHVEGARPTAVRATFLDADTPRAGLARDAERASTGGWRVDALLPWAGNWTLDLGAGHAPLDLLVPPAGADVLVAGPRREGPADPILVAREPRELVEPGPQRVRITTLYRGDDGAWRPPGASAGATARGVALDGAELFARPLSRATASSFEAELPVPPYGQWELRVQYVDDEVGAVAIGLPAVTWARGTSEPVRAARVADGEWAAAVAVPSADAFLVVAHAPGAHGEALLRGVAPRGPWALASPAWFPEPGRVEGVVRVGAPDGRAIAPDPAGATATLEPDGRAVALAAARDGYRFALDLPVGDYRLVLDVDGARAAAAFRVGGLGAGDAPGGEPPPDEPRAGRAAALVALAVGAAALAGLAWGLYRRGGMGPRP